MKTSDCDNCLRCHLRVCNPGMNTAGLKNLEDIKHSTFLIKKTRQFKSDVLIQLKQDQKYGSFLRQGQTTKQEPAS